MSRHTPGPWTYNHAPDGWTVGVFGAVICQFPVYEPDDQTLPDETQYANGRLIAAAPDLLAACEAFMACPPRDRHDIALEDIVEAAIAKAKG